MQYEHRPSGEKSEKKSKSKSKSTKKEKDSDAEEETKSPKQSSGTTKRKQAKETDDVQTLIESQDDEKAGGYNSERKG